MSGLSPKQWLFTVLFALGGYCLGMVSGFATGFVALAWWILLPLLILQLLAEGVLRGLWWLLKRGWYALRGRTPPPKPEPAVADRMFPPYKYALLGGIVVGLAHFWLGEDGQSLRRILG